MSTSQLDPKHASNKVLRAIGFRRARPSRLEGQAELKLRALRAARPAHSVDRRPKKVLELATFSCRAGRAVSMILLSGGECTVSWNWGEVVRQGRRDRAGDAVLWREQPHGAVGLQGE